MPSNTAEHSLSLRSILHSVGFKPHNEGQNNTVICIVKNNYNSVLISYHASLESNVDRTSVCPFQLGSSSVVYIEEKVPLTNINMVPCFVIQGGKAWHFPPNSSFFLSLWSIPTAYNAVPLEQ